MADRGPYNADETRVCDYLREIANDQVGCGEDPIGFLIASHLALLKRNDPLAKWPQKAKFEYALGLVSGVLSGGDDQSGFISAAGVTVSDRAFMLKMLIDLAIKVRGVE